MPLNYIMFRVHTSNMSGPFYLRCLNLATKNWFGFLSWFLPIDSRGQTPLCAQKQISRLSGCKLTARQAGPWADFLGNSCNRKQITAPASFKGNQCWIDHSLFCYSNSHAVAGFWLGGLVVWCSAQSYLHSLGLSLLLLKMGFLLPVFHSWYQVQNRLLDFHK